MMVFLVGMKSNLAFEVAKKVLVGLYRFLHFEKVARDDQLPPFSQ